MKYKLSFCLILNLVLNSAELASFVSPLLISLKERQRVREIFNKFSYDEYLFRQLPKEERLTLFKNGIFYNEEYGCFVVKNPQILQPFSRL